jgi:hypothetical protein
LHRLTFAVEFDLRSELRENCWRVRHAPRLIATRAHFYEQHFPDLPFVTRRPITRSLVKRAGQAIDRRLLDVNRRFQIFAIVAATVARPAVERFGYPGVGRGAAWRLPLAKLRIVYVF